MLKKFFTNDDWDALLKAVAILVFCTALYGIWVVATLIWFEVQPVHHGWDGLIYTAVGRGIVNGLVPYTDLFEFKPPGIFLISAASLRMYDDIRLGNALQGACTIAIMLLLLVPFLRELRRKQWKPETDDTVRILSTLVIGMMSVLYLAARAGQFQTESFASVFAVAFLMMIFADRRMTVAGCFILALLLACAVGMKESFLVVILAASLVLLPLRQSYRRLSVSVVLGTAIFIAALFMLGYLGPYVTVYLPETLIGRASFNPYPIWTLLFNAVFALRDVWTFSPHFLISLCMLWILSLVTMADGWKRPRVQWALGILVASFLVLYSYGASVVMHAQSLQDAFDQVPLPTDALFVPVLCSAVLYVLCAWIALSFLFGRTKAMQIFAAFLQHVSAVILTMVMLFAGGMLRQQFGVFLPLFAALIFSCVHGLPRSGNGMSVPHRALLGAAAIASLGLLLLPSTDYGALLADQKTAEESARAQALRIDGLMSSCGYDRYVIFGEPDVPYAYTKHSPFGPAFTRTSFTFPVKWRKPPIAYLQDTYRKHLAEAQFVIARSIEIDGKLSVDATDIPDDVWKVFEKNFTAVPPPCAAAFSPAGSMVFRFRTPSP